MKVQPIDETAIVWADQAAKPMAKSRLKRLFERPFSSMLRISSSERLAGADLEPSSIYLDKMVRNFMENGGSAIGSEMPSIRCGRSRCNCFHGSCGYSYDDEFDFQSPAFGDSAFFSKPAAAAAAGGDAVESVKGLVVCSCLAERNLLADASTIMETSKSCKSRDEYREAVVGGLRSLGYDAAICKSRWEKTSTFPSGTHDYIDVIVGGERLLVDVDFRSEFEIARPTKNYKAVLQSLPAIFVGKEDRLSKIVAVASEAARLSLKKKGLSYPPWRKPEYMKAKWLSPYNRFTPPEPQPQAKGEESEDNFMETDSKTGVAASSTGSSCEADKMSTAGAVLQPKPDYSKGKRLSGHVGGEQKTKLEGEEAADVAESGASVASSSADESGRSPSEVKTPWNPHVEQKFVVGLASVFG